MTEINRSNLFGKLNSQLYRAAEAATVFCKLRGNPYVELVHWMHQILQDQDSDLLRLIKHYGLDPSRVQADVTAELDRLPRGATAIADFSEHIDHAIERSWLYATLLYGDSVIRSGYLLVGLLKTTNLRSVLHRMSPEFRKLEADTVAGALSAVIKDSVEENLPSNDGTRFTSADEPGEASQAVAAGKAKQGEALKKYAVDLTEKARKGELDPISGRDDEIRQVIDILTRRRQNNPLLTGEAGVGKTAVVEGFASRIASGDVPPSLRGVKLLNLDIGLLQAGASMKGEFEQRLRNVIDEVQNSPTPVVLFIDEIHTLVGAGGAAGTGDAANLLKPALARGTLRTIGATTWAEYKKYIEKDPALTRRFQAILIDQPSEEKAIVMLRGVASRMEAHHKVLVLDEAIETAVKLSHRYIPARQLPDKAVSLLDTASARVSLSLHATPPHVESLQHRIEALELEQSIAQRETGLGLPQDEKLKTLAQALTETRKDLEEATRRWEAERQLVSQLLELRAKLEAAMQADKEAAAASEANETDKAADKANETAKATKAATKAAAKTTKAATATKTAKAATDEADKAVAHTPAPGAEAAPSGASPGSPEAAAAPLTPAERKQCLSELVRIQKELTRIQGESPLMLPSVNGQAVAEVVADWTGIPVGRMVRDEISAVLSLVDTLNQRVVGQRYGLEQIARRIEISRARLDDPSKPIGVFLLVGPSGVGKTETALALAEVLYGGEHNVITINMSEFQEAHTVSTLKGAPPGYVGYGEGGVLTEAVRRKPYSVVLLDEIEKAHSDVHEIFFQVFDKGWMEDGEGRRIDFHNTIIIMTSNVGSDLMMDLCRDPELMPQPAALTDAVRDPLRKVFPAAFLGRLTVIPYYPLSNEVLSQIVTLKLTRIKNRLWLNHKASFTWDQAAIDTVMSRATEIESGGRMIDTILSNNLLPRISREYLERTLAGKPLTAVHVTSQAAELELSFQPENRA
ncbi:MAG: ATP-dependent Clp protease ATP-binding subunit [Burkholderiaceae bacterium]|jgi:type VI secretion system protein VasG|nr:ATP-dependent Clp protease ATP-binding subunit [Burkholderiaceae bacterium]